MKSDRQVATFIKCVTALNDLTTTVPVCNDQGGNVHILSLRYCTYTQMYMYIRVHDIQVPLTTYMCVFVFVWSVAGPISFLTFFY